MYQTTVGSNTWYTELRRTSGIATQHQESYDVRGVRQNNETKEILLLQGISKGTQKANNTPQIHFEGACLDIGSPTSLIEL